MMREQARVIATQHKYWKTHGGQIGARNPVKFLNFEDWFNWTIDKIKSRGAQVEIICEIVFITWPGQPVTGFSKLDFEDEYKNVYRKGRRATA